LLALLNWQFTSSHAGASLRAILRFVLIAVALLFALAAGVIWWFVYRPLPRLDGSIPLNGLQKDVIVERDGWGVPHIRATTVEDMAEAQGYVMAQDRLWQMDLLRRVARGQLSEILGPATISIDKQFRTLGFGRAAERDVSLLEPAQRNIMDAYARGINLFIEQHSNKLPLEFTLLKYRPQPWQTTDSLVIAGYMYRTLTDTWEDELDREKVTKKAGWERARDLFSPDAAMDHFVVGDPNVVNDGSQRSRLDPDDEDDDDDDEMGDDDGVLKAGSGAIPPDLIPSSLSEAFPDLTSALATSIRGYLAETQRDVRHGLGSNNWVVSGSHTATGKPLLANDTHLELSIPPIWYEIHLTAPGWNVKGFTVPGAPLVVIGHNDKLAWGFTNSGADVQDLYIETFNPAAPDEYRVNKKWQKAQNFDEIIRVKNQGDEHLRIVVTRHGPIVHTEGDKAYALRWTATEPGGLANTYLLFGKAQNWEEFRNIAKRAWGPGQNIVYADVKGNIGYVLAARVPIRRKGHGEVPVPGDPDDYEWTGYIPFDQMPQALNPDDGLIVTANARVVGPAYKPYLTDRWEEPYRTARIYDLLHDKHDLRPADMLKVQTDTYSYPHVFLADQLTAAVKANRPKDPRTKKLIDSLKDWNGIADADSVEISFLAATRRAALSLILEPVLGDQAKLYEWRTSTFLQKILTDRPAPWLPAAYKNYDALLIDAADRAVAKLSEDSHSSRVEDWQWKRFNSLDMLHPIGRDGMLKRFFSISNKPQSGTGYSVRAATPHHGPAMRFVANPGNWDESILLLPAGQSGQLGSSHYSDQFSYWFEGNPIYQPFSDAAEAKARKHTLTLKAATK
jgi:penicillin G amidase